MLKKTARDDGAKQEKDGGMSWNDGHYVKSEAMEVERKGLCLAMGLNRLIKK